MIYPRAFLKGRLVNSHQPRLSSGCCGKWPQGGSISSCPTLGTWATRALGQVLFLGCQWEWLCLRLVSPYFLPLTLHSQDRSRLQHHSAEGGVIHRWGDAKEGSWRWEPQPHHQETQSPGDFANFFQSRDSTILGGTMVGSAAGGPAWIWRLWAHTKGKRKFMSVVVGGLLPGAPSPYTQPHDSPVWGPKPTQAPGMWHQPRSQGLSRIESSVLFLIIFVFLFLPLILNWNI